MVYLKKIIFSALTFFLIAASLVRAEENNIRVLLSDESTGFVLGFQQELLIKQSGGRLVLHLDKPRAEISVKPYSKGFIVDGKRLAVERIYFQSQPQGFLNVDGRNFRGSIECIRVSSKKFKLINHVGLEDYIKGVLYHEISHLWPMQALKSQAVAVRTFAVFSMKQNRAKEFDVSKDVYSQVYGARTSERFRINQAVASTKGEVITFKGEIVPAYYHATCGGRTEDASNLWNTKNPALKGVVCPFCVHSPHFIWKAEIDTADLKQKLKGSGKNLAAISTVKVLERFPSGRVKTLEFADNEKSIEISGKDFRHIAGIKLVKSTDFEINLKQDKVVLEGHGWGHGAGMCQWGQYFQAKQAKTYRQILEYYYPGSRIKKINLLR